MNYNTRQSINVNNRAFNGSSNTNTSRTEDDFVARNQERINRAANNERNRINDEYNKYENRLRRDVIQTQQRYSRQEIDGTTYNNSQQTAKQLFEELGAERKDKLEELARRQVELLERIRRGQENRNKSDDVNNQRDNTEHNKNAKWGLNDLKLRRNKLIGSLTGGEGDEKISKRITNIDSIIDKIKKKNNLGDSEVNDSNNRTYGNIARGTNIASSVVSGNVGGLVGALGSIPVIGAIAVAVAGIIKAGAEQFAARQQDENVLMKFGKDRNSTRQEFLNTKYASDYGLSGTEYAESRASLIKGSGKMSSGNYDNMILSRALEKGYGIDNVAGISGNERQDKYGKSTADNIVSMLNVLGSIKESSIKPGDLVLANEKAMLMFSLQSGQKTSNDEFDQRKVLGVMAAGEKMGGAFADDRAQSTWGQAFNSIKDGGSDNIRAMKYQFAIKARPDLARPGNEYKLSEYVESGSDPAYLASVIKGLQNMSGGNENILGFSMKEVFKGMAPNARRKLMEMNPTAAKYLKEGVDEQSTGNIVSRGSAEERLKEMALETDKLYNSVKEGARDGIISAFGKEQPNKVTFNVNPGGKTATSKIGNQVLVEYNKDSASGIMIPKRPIGI